MFLKGILLCEVRYKLRWKDKTLAYSATRMDWNSDFLKFHSVVRAVLVYQVTVYMLVNHSEHTGRFIMFSVITNIYNKKTK